MRRTSCMGAAFAAMALGMSGPAQGQASQARPDLVLRETVEGMPTGSRQDITVLTATIAPGQSTVFHTHRFPVTVYVLAGTFTLEMEGRATAVVRTGESMVEPPNVRMTGHNHGPEATRVVIFYVADPGTPFLDRAH